MAEQVSVEDLSHAFLSAWQKGKPFPIEKGLQKVGVRDRTRALRALLMIEVRARREQGENPAVEEYVRRFPVDETLIASVFELVPVSKPKKAAPVPPPPPKRNSPEKSGSPAAKSAPEKATSSTKAKRGKEDEFDEFADFPDLDDDFDSPPTKSKKTREEPLAELPKKKKKKKSVISEDDADDLPKTSSSKKKKRRDEDEEPLPPMEFTIPLILALVSFVINVGLIFVFRPDAIPFPIYLTVMVCFLIFSMVATTIALFLGAMLLDTDYGFIKTGLVKIAAICLTQFWISLLLDRIPIPFVGSIVAWLVTFFLFQKFFDLDSTEAFRSMFIAGVTHKVLGMFLLVAIFSFVLGGNRGPAIPRNNAQPPPPGVQPGVMDDDDDM